jgi:hypothetical protein
MSARIVVVDLTVDTIEDKKVVLVDLSAETVDDEDSNDESEPEDHRTVCTVCYRNMKAWDRDLLRCGHMFCYDCLLRWLGPCPICREPRV